MAAVINEKKFDRFWTITGGFLCLLALVLTIVALRTSSWTINEYSPDGEVQWHGLFYTCNRLKCMWNYSDSFLVVFFGIVSTLFLLLGTISIFLMGVHSFPRRHFYFTPSLAFVGVVFLFVASVLYPRQYVMNGISSRLMVTALILSLTSCTIVVYVAGRYSILYRDNPMDFSYRKTETNETAKKLEETEQQS